MLLRSASTPHLNKNRVAQCGVLTEIEVNPKFSPLRQAAVPLKRTSSEGDLKLLPRKVKQGKEASTTTQLRQPSRTPLQRTSSEGDQKLAAKYNGLLSTIEDAARSVVAAVEEDLEEGSGGGFPTGGGGGDDDDGIWVFGGGGGAEEGIEAMDKHYRDMITMYPGDELLLSNYAKFLKDIRGDSARAEEYCERAILVNGDDGRVLSMYGDLIWNNHKDGGRANSYFNQAVQSAPDDCNVLASYARFLWDVEEEAEEEEEVDHEEEEEDRPPEFRRLGRGRSMLQKEQQQRPPSLAIGFGTGLGFPPVAATT